MPRNGSVSTRFRRNDLLLVGFFLLTAVLMWTFINISSRSGRQVRVTVDGETFGIYSLDKNQEILISPTDHGDEADIGNTEASWHNTLLISDGKASMKEADCPDKICVHHSPVSKQGESIVCLPHKVVVEVAEEPSPDELVPEKEPVSTEEESFDLISK